MIREEMVSFIREMIYELEGVRLYNEDFEHKSDAEIDKDYQWYVHLSYK